MMMLMPPRRPPMQHHHHHPQDSSSSWNYLTFNEAVLDRMKQNGWRRERSGVCRLTPIGVGFFEPWHAAAILTASSSSSEGQGGSSSL